MTVIGSVCVCLCVSVPKLTSRIFIHAKIDTAVLMGYADQMICRNYTIMLHSKVIVLFAYLQHPIGIFYATFQWQSLLKLLKADHINTIWNMNVRQ